MTNGLAILETRCMKNAVPPWWTFAMGLSWSAGLCQQCMCAVPGDMGIGCSLSQVSTKCHLQVSGHQTIIHLAELLKALQGCLQHVQREA